MSHSYSYLTHCSTIPVFQYPMSCWPDPSSVLEYELNPMCSKYGRDMVTNMRGGTKHKLIEIEGYLATVYLFASFEETQSALVMHFQPYSGAGLTFRIPCP